MNAFSSAPVASLHQPQSVICAHCGGATVPGETYCCGGCAAAHHLIEDLRLDLYYDRRHLNPAWRNPRPEESWQNSRISVQDFAAWIQQEGDGIVSIALMVDGLHCGACVWLIEQTLLRQPGVASARVSLTSRRLVLAWNPLKADVARLTSLVQSLGYRLVPVDRAVLAATDEQLQKRLLTSLAVAGFAAGNIMLLSISIWFGGDMAPGTRNLFHWISALIAIPAIAYAGQPFFRSAIQALKHRRSNMDVPISLAIIVAPAMSIYETFTGGEHAYFDSATTLLFFLLIGRYLDQRARRAARTSAEQLVALNAISASLMLPDGTLREIPPRNLRIGDRVLVQAGARIPVDGTILSGMSEVDRSLINGETLPEPAAPGGAVFAGTLNLGAPLTIGVEKAGEQTLLAEIIRLMEVAEAQRGPYTRLADRVARYYSPVVHATALLAFLGWMYLGHLAWQQSLLIAVAVLIITCPCALALAVPVVQVMASQRLLRAGVLLKSAEALERLRHVDHVVLDKTGTLTLGKLELLDGFDPFALQIAASIAANSRHPVARALVAAQERDGANVSHLEHVEELPGQGMLWHSPEGTWRLGNGLFTEQRDQGDTSHLLYLVDPIGICSVFKFADQLRPDAAEVVAALRTHAEVEICSGDRAAIVATVAAEVGIDHWRSAMKPADKMERLERLRRQGRHVLMIGDGLNDAPALHAADVSISPSSGADISQNAADIVFQGDALQPVLLTMLVAKRSSILMKQNLALALIYNLAAVPLAITGMVTPLVAALAMSSSSILVVLNSMRLGGLKVSVSRQDR